MSFAKVMKFLDARRSDSKLPTKEFSVGKIRISFSHDSDVSSVTVGSETGEDNFDCFGFYSADAKKGLKSYFSCSPHFDALCRAHYHKPKSLKPWKEAANRIKQSKDSVDVEDVDALLAEYAASDSDSGSDRKKKDKKKKKKKNSNSSSDEESEKKPRKKKSGKSNDSSDDESDSDGSTHHEKKKKKKKKKKAGSDSSDDEHAGRKTSKKLSLSWKSMKPVNVITTKIDDWDTRLFDEGTHVLRTYLYKTIFPTLKKSKGEDLAAIFQYAIAQIEKVDSHHKDVAVATIRELGGIIKGYESSGDMRKMETYLQEAQDSLRDDYGRKDVFAYGFAAAAMLSGYAKINGWKGRFKPLLSGKGSLVVAKSNLQNGRIKGFDYPDEESDQSDQSDDS